MMKLVLPLLLLAGAYVAPACPAENAVDAQLKPSHAAYMAADYDDGLHGVHALHAVRTCVVHDIPLADPLVVLHETVRGTRDEFVAGASVAHQTREKCISEFKTPRHLVYFPLTPLQTNRNGSRFVEMATIAESGDCIGKHIAR